MVTAQVAHAQAFAGKTIDLEVGFGPGGDNDIWARTLATHLGDHIAGHPRVVVQNAPGAGGLRLINELYNLSPKDGTVIGLVNRGIPFEPLLGGDGTQFDPLRMNWIGSPDRDTTVCAARKDAHARNPGDLFTTGVVVGATGSGADTALYPEFLNHLLGMKFRVVKGYQGTKEISLAMERGEVEGLCVAYDSLMHEPLARAGKLNILFQVAATPDPRLTDVPVATSLARSQADRDALRLFLARVEVGRPLVMPEGVPPDRIQQIRDAFRATLQDPLFIADARKQGLNVAYLSGAELAGKIAAAYRAPKAVVQRVKAALGR
ncbi:MAG TPA: tripartite tricarboxylate transporter substrate-binding protein [Micropepsaceae bacterium]|nr:tripartite tricarboxylate transporter substrate-binding protein [Micropepsaceae bacterium]